MESTLPPNASRRGNRHWFRDHGALLIGCVAGAALILIAQSSLLDPRADIERDLNLIRRSAESELLRAWETGGQNFRPDFEPTVALDLNGPLPAFDPASARPIDLAPEEQTTAFDALFEESTRSELAGELPQAIDDLQDARALTDDPRRKLQADLRMLLLAARAEDFDTLAEALRRLLQTTDGRETLRDVSVLLTALVAVLPLESEDHQDFKLARDQLIELGARGVREGTLALPALEGRVERVGMRETLVLDPTRAIYLQPLLDSPETGLAELADRRLQSDRLEWISRHFGSFELAGRPQFEIRTIDRFTPGPKGAMGRLSLTIQSGPTRAWLVRRDELLPQLTKWLISNSRLEDTVEFELGFTDDPHNKDQTRQLENTPIWLRASLPDARQYGKSMHRDYGLVRFSLHALGAMAVGLGALLHRQRKRELAIQELKSDFVANVSHELRTPLSSILLMAENLTQDKVQEQTRDRYHSLILREAQRLRRLVDDVLDFSRLDRGDAPKARLEPHRADRLASNLTEDAQRWADQHGIALTIQAQWPETNIDADEDALQRAMLNLLDNARRHSGSSQIELELREESHALWIGVRDFGRGIPEGMSRKLFDPYVQLESKQTQGHGAGLGLSIVAAIATAHGGTVVANNHPEGGALFAVILPLSDSNHDDSTPSR